MLALSFARSVSRMAFALRLSVLPLIDNVLALAFVNGVEPNPHFILPGAELEAMLRRSSISLQHFANSKYFASELPPNNSKRKTLNL